MSQGHLEEERPYWGASQPIGEENPYTSVVAEPNHGTGSCLITWILDTSKINFSSGIFLI